jgi:hypothetical protein
MGAAPASTVGASTWRYTSAAMRVLSCPSTSATCSSGTPAADISDAAEWRISYGVHRPIPARYHFGPAKIAMNLARYHDVAVSRSVVWRILKRLDMNRPPSSQRYKRHDRRWKRYEKQLPGHRLQVDVKFIEPLASSPRTGGRKKRYYQLAAIDDCTRIRVLRIYERNTQKNAIQFIDYVLAKLASYLA